MKGIYIHVPFCIKKCNYCDFCSFPKRQSVQDHYVRRAILEMETYRKENIKADTLYLGGGTPSLLSVEHISKIIEGAKENFCLAPQREITIEVNPCTLTEEKARHWKSLGINRVSLGAQTFSDKELKILGRVHSSDDAKKAFYLLRDCGFDNISLDLMYAIPCQSMESLSKTLEEFLILSPEHISCYGLKIEDGTLFSEMEKRGEMAEKSDEEYEQMYSFIQRTLSNAGYGQYELSNFSKPGRESRHNLKYWQGEEYVGIGPSASSFYKSKRYTRTSDLDVYLQSFENIEEYELSRADLMSEYMFLSLRLTKLGAQKKEFEKRFSCKMEDVFGDALSKHLNNGLIEDAGDRYVLADKAYYVSNYVFCDFV